MIQEHKLLDLERSPTTGLVAKTGCSYFSSIAFPDLVWAGLRAAGVRTSVVRYQDS